MATPAVTRFAPSPTGSLHFGHACSALFAWETANRGGGQMILRIEDIDFTRCHVESEAGIYEDLKWLGIAWPNPVRRQSEHRSEYLAAAEGLRRRGLLYPCFCTRKDIQREIEASGHAPHGIAKTIYPGICRALSDDEREARIAAGIPYALRLNVERALASAPHPLEWIDRHQGLQRARPELQGDVVIVRKDIGCSYHLAVTLDDALQHVTCVTRGVDLFEATHVQRLLQAVLGLPTPEHYHHPLIRNPATGQRLAKRDQSESLKSLRLNGLTVSDVYRAIKGWLH